MVIDATVGNGHDTLFLARCVGDSGHVYGFDRQAAAIAATRARLREQGMERRVTLYQAGHETLAQWLPTRLAVKAALFNLGYLPGGDKRLTTHSITTLAALDALRDDYLIPQALLSVIAYRGHPGGEAETHAVREWFEALAREGGYTVHRQESSGTEPVWWRGQGRAAGSV